ncbi:MAG: LysM peptidoglycan-binding domain-containing protein [Proteobacteria bacterium]|nr:LysM peptidoglycan-binding domain-containing protein [Pseudomonadota bacterium]
MTNIATRQLTKGLMVLAGLLLISACAGQIEPFSVVEDTDQASSQANTVEAIIAESEPAETVIYEPQYPDTYIVQKGDTLWDISAEFLRDPWHWPEIWFKNPQIENPHLIYPGDILAIIYINGQKRVQLVRRGADGAVLSTGGTGTGTTGMTVVKLSPRIRSQSIDASIPSIPIESIRHLLARPQVIDQEQLSRAAYIISSVDAHLINSMNDKLYVRKLDTSSGSGRYQIFRPDKPIFDPATNELLGYQALYVGDSKLLSGGDPATVLVTNSVREILRNDRVLPLDNTNFERDFFPRPPAAYVQGEVVSLLDAISQLGQYQTLAINLGARDGVQTGNLLNIKRIGDVIPDTQEEDPAFRVKLPDERIGIVMIIRSFEKMSYALVMEADRPISLRDFVESP